MNLQTYLALQAVVDADYEKLLFVQALTDVDPPNGVIKTIGPSAILSFADGTPNPAISYKFNIDPMQEGTGDPYPSRTYSGSTVTIEDTKNENAESVIVNIDPVQEGSGDPSPDNIRSITGWSEVNIVNSGKNKLALPIDYQGNVAINKNNCFPVKAGSYIVSFTKANNFSSYRWCIYMFDEEGNALLDETHKPSNSFSSSGNYWLKSSNDTTSLFKETAINIVEDCYIRILIGYGDTTSRSTVEGGQLEEGSTVTTYDLYRVDDITSVSFPLAVGTVYGGTVDITKGKLVANKGYIASYDGETLDGAWISSMDVYTPGGIPTIGAQIVYELASPITYDLTPQEIELFTGRNVIFADTGNITVVRPGNVRPISGWTGAKVHRTRKNLFDGMIQQGQINSQGQNAWSNTRIRCVGYIPVKPNMVYTLSRNVSTDALTVRMYDAKREFLGVGGSQYFKIIPGKGYSSAQPMIAGYTTCSFTFGDGVAYFRFQDISNDLTAKYQLEVGSIATDYEPYQENIFDITFPTEAGTIYGGKIDLTKGKLTVDKAIVDLGTLTWTKSSTNVYMYSNGIANTLLKPKSPSEVIDFTCSHLTAASANAIAGTVATGGLIGSPTNGNIRCRFDGFSIDPQEFKESVSGFMLVYPIANPVTYDLTPQEIDMFKGNNTIWANTGDSTLTYKAKKS